MKCVKNKMFIDLLMVFLGFALRQIYGMSSGNNTVMYECPDEPTCLKCGPEGCIKCPSLIVYPSRRCVHSCPLGHRTRWSTHVGYMGRICVHNGNPLGLSGDSLAVFAGFLAGTAICTVLVTSAVVYVKYKRRNAQTQITVDTSSELDDSPERREFLKQLEVLRPQAELFLEMLNETRRQVRLLHVQGGDAKAMAAYRPVLRDLSKMLLLLNRAPSRTPVPDDWEQLFDWAEKALSRYKRRSDISQPQMAQLISFLQSPPSQLPPSISTFKPSSRDRHSPSSLSLQDLAVRRFNTTYESAALAPPPMLQTPLNPQWRFEYSLLGPPVPVSPSEFNPELWKTSREQLHSSLFLDDDFQQLGCRPQDEITTEL